MSKRRIIHAVSYEFFLLVIIAIAFSFIFDIPVEVAGTLGIIMAVVSVFWNMVFNHYFEKIEAKYQWKRTVKIRILHAVGFEGGLMILTIPMVAYVLNMTLIQAFIVDIALTLSVLVYTFIFQWCYDHIEIKLGYSPRY